MGTNGAKIFSPVWAGAVDVSGLFGHVCPTTKGPFSLENGRVKETCTATGAVSDAGEFFKGARIVRATTDAWAYVE